MYKHGEKFIFISLALLLYTLLGLNGCKDTEKENAIKEAAQAKAELASVQSILEKTKMQREKLEAKVSEVTESLNAAKAKVQTLIQSGTQAVNFKEKLNELTTQKDNALAKAADLQTMVQTLQTQLQQQLQKVTGLEGQNKKLLQIIDELKNKLGADVQIPSIPNL